MTGTALVVSLAGLAAVSHPYVARAALPVLPQGGTVVVGAASIASTSPGALNVTTATNHTAITWNSFSIGAGGTVAINQPSASAVTLNEVTGANPSRIFGSLTSNGQVVLANPNGIWFGPGSHVDVASLVASTATASQAALAAFAKGGALMLDQAGNPSASIVNDGSISIGAEGLAGLVAPGVANNGVIAAKLGHVVLASGTVATLDFYGDGLISFAVGGSVTAQPKDQAGKALAAAVTNSGSITAPGGTVLLTAAAAKTVVDNTINMSGVVVASAIAQNGGEIDLEGGSGTTTVSGTLQASSKTGTGGTIDVTGKSVQLAATASLTANGTSGGTIAVGGGVHGGGSLAHATDVSVAQGATLTADGTTGTGGTISVWSDGATQVAASLTAIGAVPGGLVETSGETLDFGGISVRTSNWLLDPVSLELTDTNQANLSTALNAGTNIALVTFATSAIASTTSASGVPTGGFGTQSVSDTAGNIIVDAAGGAAPSGISWSSDASLTLNAYGAVVIASGAAIQTSGSGTISLDAGAGVSLAATAVVSTVGGTISTSDTGATGGTGSSLAGTISGAIVSLADAGALTFAPTAAISATESIALSAGASFAFPTTLANGSTYLTTTPSLSIYYGGGPIELGTSVTTGLALTPTILSELGVATSGGTTTFALGDTARTGGTIATDGALSFTGTLSLEASTGITLAGDLTAAGNLDFLTDVTLGTDSDLTANTVTFGRTVDGAHGLTIDGNAEFDWIVGGTTPLASLEVTGTTALYTPAVTTIGTQDYQGAVSLVNPDPGYYEDGFTISQSASAPVYVGYGVYPDPVLTGSTITFAGTLDGTDTLTINGNAIFGGTVGGTAPLGTIEVIDDSVINTPAITTTGTQQYQGAVTLSRDTALTGSTVSFNSTVDGAHALTINGNAEFDGIVGGTTPLVSLDVTGTTGVYTTAVTTTETQDYQGAVYLVRPPPPHYYYNDGGYVDGTSYLGSIINAGYTITQLPVYTTNVIYPDPVLTGSTVTFAGTLNGAEALTINGNATFAGTVGGTAPLGTIAVVGGTINLLSDISTTGAQSYTGAIELGSGTRHLSSVDGDLTFSGTITGTGGLQLATDTGNTGSGDIYLNDAVITGDSLLSDLSITSANAVSVNGVAALVTGGTVALATGSSGGSIVSTGSGEIVTGSLSASNSSGAGIVTSNPIGPATTRGTTGTSPRTVPNLVEALNQAQRINTGGTFGPGLGYPPGGWNGFAGDALGLASFGAPATTPLYTITTLGAADSTLSHPGDTADGVDDAAR